MPTMSLRFPTTRATMLHVAIRCSSGSTHPISSPLFAVVCLLPLPAAQHHALLLNLLPRRPGLRAIPRRMPPGASECRI